MRLCVPISTLCPATVKKPLWDPLLLDFVEFCCLETLVKSANIWTYFGNSNRQHYWTIFHREKRCYLFFGYVITTFHKDYIIGCKSLHQNGIIIKYPGSFQGTQSQFLGFFRQALPERPEKLTGYLPCRSYEHVYMKISVHVIYRSVITWQDEIL